jgi:hypothetical protein
VSFLLHALGRATFDDAASSVNENKGAFRRMIHHLSFVAVAPNSFFFLFSNAAAFASVVAMTISRTRMRLTSRRTLRASDFTSSRRVPHREASEDSERFDGRGTRVFISPAPLTGELSAPDDDDDDDERLDVAPLTYFQAGCSFSAPCQDLIPPSATRPERIS